MAAQCTYSIAQPKTAEAHHHHTICALPSVVVDDVTVEYICHSGLAAYADSTKHAPVDDSACLAGPDLPTAAVTAAGTRR